MGNNDSRSLPQVGLEAADVVYEAHIENGVTRFLAVYHSEVPLRVGPVRSARSSDIDLIGNLEPPDSFAYWGSNEGVGVEVEQAIDLRDVRGMPPTTGQGQHLFFRGTPRAVARSPYNGFFDAGGHARGLATGSAPDPIFTFGGPAGIGGSDPWRPLESAPRRDHRLGVGPRARRRWLGTTAACRS